MKTGSSNMSRRIESVGKCSLVESLSGADEHYLTATSCKAVFLSLSSFVLAFAFMIGSASSRLFEGWMMVLLQRPVRPVLSVWAYYFKKVSSHRPEPPRSMTSVTESMSQTSSPIPSKSFLIGAQLLK